MNCAANFIRKEGLKHKQIALETGELKTMESFGKQ